MNKMMSIMVTIVLLLLALVFLETPLSDMLTDETSETFSTTTDSNGAVSVTLAKKHWYSDTDSMTVTNTVDGTITTDATLGADRITVALTGMTASTAASTTVNYLTETSNNLENIGLKSFPFIVTAIMLFVAFSTVRGGVKTFRSGGSSDVAAGTAILVIVGGVIVMPIIFSFRDEANTAFNNAPEYIGVTIAMPLVILGYIFSLVGIGIGSIGPAARDAFS